MPTYPSGVSLANDDTAGQISARDLGYMSDAAMFRHFNHIGQALHIKRIPFYCFLINKKSYAAPTRLKCYAHRKKIQIQVYWRVIQEWRREGGERGWEERLTVAARAERKITRIQPRGNTTVAMRYVSVIKHIRGCYANLQHDATVVTSSYTCDVPFERNNEIFNTRKLYNTDLYVSNSMMHRKFVQ